MVRNRERWWERIQMADPPVWDGNEDKEEGK